MVSLRKKLSVFGVILVRIFLQSDWIRKDTEYFSVFSPNAGKYGPECLRIQTFFTQCHCEEQSNAPIHKYFTEWLFRTILKICWKNLREIIQTFVHTSLQVFSCHICNIVQKSFIQNSSNINEGIKAVLFFKRKDFTRTKSTTTHISKQKQKRQF